MSCKKELYRNNLIPHSSVLIDELVNSIHSEEMLQNEIFNNDKTKFTYSKVFYKSSLSDLLLQQTNENVEHNSDTSSDNLEKSINNVHKKYLIDLEIKSRIKSTKSGLKTNSLRISRNLSKSSLSSPIIISSKVKIVYDISYIEMTKKEQ
jgi:hypothetical protein